MQHELVLFQRLTKLVFQREPAGHGFGHLLRVEQISFGAPFGFLERGLRIPE